MRPIGDMKAALPNICPSFPSFLCSNPGLRARGERLSDGACRTQLFPPADLPVAAPLRERLCGATLGKRLCDRMSADVVGRRGRFLEGRHSPDA